MKKLSIIFVILISGFFVISCKSPWEGVPLTEGDIPYAIPAGEYKDINGNIHNESKVRWSISEADLYRNYTDRYRSDSVSVTNYTSSNCAIYNIPQSN